MEKNSGAAQSAVQSSEKADAVQKAIGNKVVPKKEFVMFSVAALGQGMVYAIMSSYISDFYINVMQLPLLFVLLLMLFARVWDAINDPMMGVIIDRNTTKWGKMKPYAVFMALPIAVFTFLIFFDPQFSGDKAMTYAMVYAGFTYVLWGMTYTVADIPFWTMPNVMTPDPAERANIISIGRTTNGIGSALPMVLFAVLGWIPYFTSGGIQAERTRYMLMAVICSVLGIGLFITSFFFTKERVIIPSKPRRDKSEPSMLKRIFTCKPLMLVVLMGILSSGRYMMQAAAVHVARYAFYIGPSLESVVADAAANYAGAGFAGSQAEYILFCKTNAIKSSVSTVSTLFSICSAVGMFGSMLFMPFLYKKFNYKQIILASCFAGFLGSVATTVLGACAIYTPASWLVYLTIPFIIIQCIPLGAINITSYAMIGDSLDYLELKTGCRDNALGSACQSFVNKLGNALATCFIVVMYLIINLNPADMLSSTAVIAATELPLSQRFGMFSLVSIVPGVSLLVCAIPIFWYDLTGGKKDKITRELAEMRAEKGISVN